MADPKSNNPPVQMPEEKLVFAMTILHFLATPSTPVEVERKFNMALAQIELDRRADPKAKLRHNMDTETLALTMAILHLVHGKQPSRNDVEIQYRTSLVQIFKYRQNQQK